MSRGLLSSAHDHCQDDPVRSQLTRGLLRLEIRGSWCMPVPKVIGPRLRQWVSSMARGSRARGGEGRDRSWPSPTLSTRRTRISFRLRGVTRLRGVRPSSAAHNAVGLAGEPAPRGQTEFQVNLKLGLTPWPTDPMAHCHGPLSRLLVDPSLGSPDVESASGWRGPGGAPAGPLNQGVSQWTVDASTHSDRIARTWRAGSYWPTAFSFTGGAFRCIRALFPPAMSSPSLR